MKRIKIESLQPADIILTSDSTKIGQAIQISTRGIVTHAMICVQYGSIIDSSSEGVQARNLQREVFEDHEAIFAFRMKNKMPAHKIAQIIDFARSKIGTRYSEFEAARTVFGNSKPRNKREFCSRLVPRAYHSVGIELVSDYDYCSPEELRTSPLLIELSDISEPVTDEDIAWMDAATDPNALTVTAQNTVLECARRFDSSIENFEDVAKLVRLHPEWDGAIANAYRASGYLDLWKHEHQVNPWRYSFDEMEAVTNENTIRSIRIYCIETIREKYSGGFRFYSN